MEKISKNIVRLRQDLGVTQAYIAQRLHIDNSAYSRLESGKTKIDIQRLNDIAKILGSPISEIIGDIEYENMVFVFWLKLSDNSQVTYELKFNDFPDGVENEYEALDYIKKSVGAIEGDVLANTYNGYHSSSNIFKCHE